MAKTDATMVRAEREMVTEAEKYKSPYERWKEAEGLPTVRGYFVKNLLTMELAPWKSSGDGLSAIVNLEGTGGFNDAHVTEIPAGKSLKPHKHLYEETIYILKGQGATSVWLDEARKQSFEWQAGSYFAIPMNAWHQHFNVSGTEPARFVAMTSAPRIIDSFDEHEFVFENNFVFKSRFNDEEGYFKQSDRKPDLRRWQTNFV
ncbi:MAG TPA: cupin domain-containing protein, partial [Candidatus Binatia bacterium]